MLCDHIDELVKLREMEERAPRTEYVGPLAVFDDGADGYSLAVGLPRDAFASCRLKSGGDVLVQDVLDGTQSEEVGFPVVDVIVTDPPYGFNTDENLEELADLYARAIERMVTDLDDGGQLVMCLPDRSMTGRYSPFFTHKKFVTHQVLSAAHATGKEAVTTAEFLPQPQEAFRFPYYWESERALRRAVLHFQFRRHAEPGPGKAHGES